MFAPPVAPNYNGDMAVHKVSVSLEDDAYRAAKAAADGEGVSLSAWLSRAARRAARRAAGLRAIAEYEAEYGPIPDDAVERARDALERADRGESVRL